MSATAGTAQAGAGPKAGPKAEAGPKNETVRTACLQLQSGDDPAANLQAARALLDEAASEGAQFVATPECTGLISGDREAVRRLARREGEDIVLAGLREAAAKRGLWLLIGSLLLRDEEGGAEEGEKSADGAKARAMLRNRSFLVAPDGSIAARYDKIHLFDADLPGSERHRESELIRPGGAAVAARLPWARLGMSVCYDLRFPALYRALAADGATWLSVPAAFTVPTGRAHWHILLRARAIENGCFVFAPAQTGRHPGGRRTYGRSLIISPWGRVLAEASGAGEGESDGAPQCLFADIRPEESPQARAQIPALAHGRDFRPPELV